MHCSSFTCRWDLLRCQSAAQKYCQMKRQQSPQLKRDCVLAGNGLIQLIDYARDEFEWQCRTNAGGILSLALQPAEQYAFQIMSI